MVGSAVVAHLRAGGHEISTLFGDARDPAAVTAALDGVDAVAHLAAIANPWHESPYELFGNNVLATFTVLWTAATSRSRPTLPTRTRCRSTSTRTPCARSAAASGVVLRLPLMIAAHNEAPLRAWASREPQAGVGDGWGWLDVRDAAEAFRLAVVGDYDGVHVVHVAVPDVFADEPTEELLDRFAPDVPRREQFPGRTAPIDTTRAKELLGFVPRYFGELF
jgi:nucleoside-diphosphate-sugar epimerase